MGSAATATTISPWNTVWNPSTLRYFEQIAISLFDSPLQPDASDREGGMAVAIGAKQLGISESDLGMLAITSWFDGWGNDKIKNRVITAGYGFPVSKNLSAGTAIRYLRQCYQYKTEIDWSLGIGFLYSHKLEIIGDRFSIGTAINDIQFKQEKERNKIPLTSRIGIAYHPDNDTIFSCDLAYRHEKDIEQKDRFRAFFGAERWLFNKTIGIRTGYSTTANYDRFTHGEWSRGVSLQTGLGEISYAYVSGKNIEPGLHLISATLRWGGTKDKLEQTQPVQSKPILMPGEIKEAVNIPYDIFSPNNDGEKDTIPIQLNIEPNQEWTLEIIDSLGNNVSVFNGIDAPNKPVVWDGKDSDGNIVPEGNYVIKLSFSDNLPVSQNNIIVDTTPPVLSVSTEPLLIMSQSEHGYTKEIVLNVPKILLNVSEQNTIEEWSIEISDDAGNVLQKFGGKDKPKDTIIWDNWEEKIVIDNENQQFNCSLVIQDSAANKTNAETTISAVDISKITGRRDERGIVVSLPSVAFDTNEYEVNDEYFDVLKEAADVIMAYPKSKAQIEGHTDDVGDDEYNLELSKKRANAVRTYLIENFDIEPGRLIAVGFGETQPIASNQTTEGRQKNRRVDIVLLPGDDSVKEPPRIHKNESIPREAEIPTDISSEEKNTQKNDIDSSKQTFVIQVGTYRQKINAETVVKIIEKLELNKRIWVSEALIRGSIWHRVMVGDFNDRTSVQKVADELNDELGWEVVILSKDEMD